jgi:hypothetical protein
MITESKKQKEYLLYLVDMYYKYIDEGANKMAVNYGKRIGKILSENQTDLSAKELFPKQKLLTKSTTDND